MSNNTFQFIGNLVNDSEFKTAKTTAILSFRLAVSDGYGDKKFTDYHTVKAFGKTAEYNNNLAKGDRVLVTGRVKSNSYEKDGKKVYSTDFVADRVYRIVKVDADFDPAMTNINKNIQAVKNSFSDVVPTYTDEELPF